MKAILVVLAFMCGFQVVGGGEFFGLELEMVVVL
jgi:hypothetical protein